eukprot:1161603-Pelagomonas_calceolata.AAC.15
MPSLFLVADTLGCPAGWQAPVCARIPACSYSLACCFLSICSPANEVSQGGAAHVRACPVSSMLSCPFHPSSR